MKRVPHRFWFFALVLMLTSAGSASAALPAEVDGQAVPSLAPMLERVIPGVVNIGTEGRVAVRDPFFDDPMFRRFFNVPQMPRERRTQGLGSGVIVDAARGYIITNNHVIEKAEKITVTLHDGRQETAKVIGTDPESDIAVIQIKAADLNALPLADSDRVRVGDFVVAIGNPFGLGQTVTSGIVSALGRSGLGIEGYEDFIQTDASINPGNSGGALVNLRGELVGINTAILSRSGGNIGIGFAIPLNMVRKIMDQLVEHGEIRRGQLGVHIQDLTEELARAFNIKVNKGAVIANVIPGTPADRAGLKSGDIVTKVNNKRVKNAADLRNAIGLLSIGERVRLTVLRDGSSRDVVAVIAQPKLSKQDATPLHRRLEGAVLGDITEGSPLFGQIEGIQVVQVEPGSSAWAAGLREGDVITSVNRVRVKNLNDFRAAVKRDKRAILLNVRRGSGALFLLLQ